METQDNTHWWVEQICDCRTFAPEIIDALDLSSEMLQRICETLNFLEEILDLRQTNQEVVYRMIMKKMIPNFDFQARKKAALQLIQIAEVKNIKPKKYSFADITVFLDEFWEYYKQRMDEDR